MTKRLKMALFAAAVAATVAGCARVPLGPMIDRRTDPGERHPGDPPIGERR